VSRVWDDVLSEQDRAVYAEAGYGQRGGFTEHPAVLVIDVTYDFCGDRPEPILESIQRFRNSCGEVAWEALPRIRELTEAGRAAGLPVIYTHAGYRPDAVRVGGWARKNARALAPTEVSKAIGNDFPTMIAPQPSDIVIEKDKPSAFFGTPLMSYLVALGVDGLLVCGTTTSGCVRASVLDAFSYNLPLAVVEECTFDRGEVSHKINLFDMQAKYADVVSLADTLAFIRTRTQAPVREAAAV
jgi:nicotinamidase-related amidase